MAQTTLSVRMDADTKRQLDELCENVGMSTSTAINLFAKAFIREQKLPFEVKAKTPNADTIAAIKEVEQMKKNPKLGKKYDDVDVMMRDLLS